MVSQLMRRAAPSFWVFFWTINSTGKNILITYPINYQEGQVWFRRPKKFKWWFPSYFVLLFHIYPYMCYCNHIWGSIYESNLKKLSIHQKRTIRIISGTRPKEHTDPLFERLGLMKLMSLNKYLIGKYSCFVTTSNKFQIFLWLFQTNSRHSWS